MARAGDVKLVRAGSGRWQLLKDGKSHIVCGAGGSEKLDLLKACGGNSIRTWGADKAARDLDQAQRLGLTVTLGIWLGHKEHGFRYDNAEQVARQKEQVRQVVERNKKHPALLFWGIGNEMEGDGADPQVWRAVEDIAAMIKQLDPDHPTVTVTAEIGRNGDKARQVKTLCPSVDILGVNAYGGAVTLGERLRACGWEKPYIVTEFGPPGPWEVGKTSWGAALEPTSTEKAAIYARSFQKAVADQSGYCLGSYAFLWGDKMEATPTWFGLFEPETGDRLGGVDALARAWGGRVPGPPAPELMRFDSTAAKAAVVPGSTHSVICEARAASGPLAYRFAVRSDDPKNWHIEPGQKVPRAVAGAIPGESATGKETMTAPTQPGPYRLYVVVRDNKGGAATANFPFQVGGA